MKAQSEATIQFSGYPLSIVETKQDAKKAELTIVKSLITETSIHQTPIADDPKNWDVEWFNGYE
jgi:hypothetical protein